MMEPIWITKAEYIEEYIIALSFSDGVQKVVDLKNHLQGEMFEPLKDLNQFKNFTLSDWTIEWNNGADLAPEFLYSL